MLDIQKYIGAPKIIVDMLDDRTATFEIEYLPRWFGHSLWNAVRRIMLWYDIWWSITALKIKGVPHEYHVIDGVKQSVIDIMLNFKALRFRIDESVDTETWVSHTFSWVGSFNAGDINFPAGITVLNPEQALFDTSDSSLSVSIEMRVEKWYGYYSIDYLKSREDKKDDWETNILLLDNDFRLTEYVTYEVQQVIDDFKGGVKDKLVVTVKVAHQGINPKDFLAFAGEVLASYAKLFIFDSAYVDKSLLTDYDDLHSDRKEEKDSLQIKTMPIDALPLSERTRNALIKNNILYVEDLEKKKKWELLLMKGVGRKAIDEISSALANINKALQG